MQAVATPKVFRVVKGVDLLRCGLRDPEQGRMVPNHTTLRLITAITGRPEWKAVVRVSDGFGLAAKNQNDEFMFNEVAPLVRNMDCSDLTKKDSA